MRARPQNPGPEITTSVPPKIGPLEGLALSIERGQGISEKVLVRRVLLPIQRVFKLVVARTA